MYALFSPPGGGRRVREKKGALEVLCRSYEQRPKKRNPLGGGIAKRCSCASRETSCSYQRITSCNAGYPPRRWCPLWLHLATHRRSSRISQNRSSLASHHFQQHLRQIMKLGHQKVIGLRDEKDISLRDEKVLGLKGDTKCTIEPTISCNLYFSP